MDIIAHPRSVGRGIIVSENAHFVELPYRDLRNVRAEIVGDTVRVFPDQPRFMRPHGIEIPKDRYIKSIVRFIEIAQNIFDEKLCPTVRICCGKRKILFDRHRMRIAVNGGRGGKHDVLTAVSAHRIEQYEHARDVVMIIFERLLHRLAYRFQPRKIDDRIDLIFGKDLIERGGVEDIVFIKFDRLPHDLFYPADRFVLAIDQIVDHDHAIARFYQFDASMAADIAGSARYENIFHFSDLLQR